jgi:hypothetical protein
LIVVAIAIALYRKTIADIAYSVLMVVVLVFFWPTCCRSLFIGYCPENAKHNRTANITLEASFLRDFFDLCKLLLTAVLLECSQIVVTFAGSDGVLVNSQAS